MVELVSGANGSGTIVFAGGGTLKLDGTGLYGFQVSGFGIPDMFDLAAVNFASATKQFNSATDTLTVTDGTHAVSIQLIGSYTSNSFNLTSEGGGSGTVVTDPPVGGGQSDATVPDVSPLGQYIAGDIGAGGAPGGLTVNSSTSDLGGTVAPPHHG
jgi:hypothetical protein